jgi:tetratricopeptide (TPR) repeat protein
VIDFGVAKAIDQQLTDRTMFTQLGTVVGTFEYMSPEQAEMSPLGIDTRSDVYSLGVLLYELLTGTTPLDRQKISSLPFADLVKRIREDEPVKPSTCVHGSKEMQTTISARRRTDPAKLEKSLRGELDWIAMKALEKDRSRRYETASALARDVERYLHDEPVEAGPPSTVYRMSKFARKNKLVIGTAGAFTVLLAIAASVAAVLAVRARAAEHLATTAQASTQVALDQSEAARAQAEGMVQFLVSVFRKPDPAQEGRDVKLADVLERAALTLKRDFKGTPKAKAQMLSALGQTFLGLGLADRAIEVLGEARALVDAELGPESEASLAVHHELGVALFRGGRIKEALALLDKTYESRAALLGAEHPQTLASRHWRAFLLREDGQLASAVKELEAVLALRERVLGAGNVDTILTRQRLSTCLLDVGRIDDAINHAEQAAKQMAAHYPPDHPDALSPITDLATAYGMGERWQEAIELGEKLVPRTEAVFGPAHHNTWIARNNLAENYRLVGRLPEAIALNERNLPAAAAKLAVDHPLILTFRDSLAEAHHDAGHWDEALRLHRQNVRLSAAKLGENHASTLDSRHNLAATLDSAGRLAEALPIWRDLVARCRGTPECPESTQARALAGLGANLLAQGQIPEAEVLLRESLKLREKVEPDLWTTFDTRSLLGAVLLAQGKSAEAQPLLRAGYDGLQAREKRLPWAARARLADARKRLEGAK